MKENVIAGNCAEDKNLRKVEPSNGGSSQSQLSSGLELVSSKEERRSKHDDVQLVQEEFDLIHTKVEHLVLSSRRHHRALKPTLTSKTPAGFVSKSGTKLDVYRD